MRTIVYLLAALSITFSLPPASAQTLESCSTLQSCILVDLDVTVTSCNSFNCAVYVDVYVQGEAVTAGSLTWTHLGTGISGACAMIRPTLTSTAHTCSSSGSAFWGYFPRGHGNDCTQVGATARSTLETFTYNPIFCFFVP